MLLSTCRMSRAKRTSRLRAQTSEFDPQLTLSRCRRQMADSLVPPALRDVVRVGVQSLPAPRLREPRFKRPREALHTVVAELSLCQK